MMLEVVETRDVERISRLLLIKEIKMGLLTHDLDPSKLEDERVIFYILRAEDEDVGIVIFFNLSLKDKKGLYGVDIGFVNRIRGMVAKKLAQMAKIIFLTEHDGARIMARIARKHRASRCFAKWLGFEDFSTDDFHYYMEMKDGRDG